MALVSIVTPAYNCKNTIEGSKSSNKFKLIKYMFYVYHKT